MKKRLLIPKSELFDILKRSFRRTTTAKIRFADRDYLSCGKEEAFKFARNSATFYKPESNDCDDAAWMFKAEAIKAQRKERLPYAVGVIWMPSHAVGFAVDEARAVWVYDGPNIMLPSALPEEATLILA